MYEYNSCMKSYIPDFLKREKLVVADYTYIHYCGKLQHLDRFLIGTGCGDCNVTESQILQWVASINGKSSTVSYYIAAVRSFFEFLKGYGFHPFLPPYPKMHYDYMAYDFSNDEIEQIFLIADSYPHKEIYKYPYCCYELPMLLRLLYGCGLRLGEATTIKFQDIDFDKNTLSLRKTKHKKQRIVPVDDSLADILARYCMVMGIGADTNVYIFPGLDFSEAIPSYVFMNHFRWVLKKAGIDLPGRKEHERGPCIHCFRHTFSHRSFKKGVSEGWSVNDQIPWLSIYLGHNSLTETEKYLKFNIEMFAEEISPFEKFSTDIFPEVNFDG